MHVRGPKSGFRKTINVRRDLRKNLTAPEQRFWYYVARKKFQNLKFRQQHGIGPYIVDFYCPEKKLIIELDGDTHASDDAKHHDTERSNYLRSLGYTVIRYTNHDIMENIEGVFEDLAKQVSSLRPPLTPPHEEGNYRKDKRHMKQIQFIDTHAHVEFSGYKDDALEVMQRALDGGVVVVNVGTQIDTSRESVKMLEHFSENVWAVVGLHPEHTFQHLVDEEESHFRSREEIFDYDAYKKLADNPRVVGIGECGLDYYRFDDSSDIGKIKEKQRAAFYLQIRLAQELGKALVIHCRPSRGTVDAYVDMLHIVEEVKLLSPELRFEVHCFTGTWEIAEKIIALGGYLGLNGIITFDKTGVSEEVVRNTPLENIILETDCPFLTPVPFRGKRNEPLYVKYVAEKIAQVKNISVDGVARVTMGNAKKLFAID